MANKNHHLTQSSAWRSEKPMPLDELDRLILRLLQTNGRITSLELSRQVQLSPAGLQKRLKKLEGAGVIDGYVMLVNREAVGLDLLCFTQVTLAHDQPTCAGDFCDRVQELPEILECHHLTGDFDYLLKIVVSNHRHLEHVLQKQITQLPGVERIRTDIVLREVKTSSPLPLD